MFVIQSVAKNLGCIAQHSSVDVSEILRRYAPLDDKRMDVCRDTASLLLRMSISKVLSSLLLSLLVLLGVARLHLGEGQVREGTHEGTARTEVDARFLDERVAEVLLGHRALAGDTDLQAAEVAQTHDFRSGTRLNSSHHQVSRMPSSA